MENDAPGAACDDTGHDGVHGRLHVLREPTAKVKLQRRGWRDGQRVTDQGFLKTGASEDAGMDAVRQDAQVLEGPARGFARLGEERRRSQVPGANCRAFAAPQLK